MKPVHSLLIPALALLSIASKCSGSQQSGQPLTPPPTDSLVLNLLGKSRVDLIRAADRVAVRSLAPDGHPEVWAEAARIPDLVAILCRKESYTFSKVLEKCPVGADVQINLRVSQGRPADSLLVLVNTQCRSWQFVYQGQVVAEDALGPQNGIEAWLSAVLLPARPEKSADKPERPTAKKDTASSKNTGKPAAPSPGAGAQSANHLEQRFGAALAQNILQAGTVSVFALDPEKKPSDSSSVFNGFAVVQKQEKLSAPLRKKLIDIINNPNNHVESRLAKNCTFLPDIGFRFSRVENGKTAYSDVLVAFYCDDWMFRDGANRQIRDCAVARKELLELARKIFPGDAYFKQLPLRNK
ncbi:MAG: hypothetical protein IT260_12270 [Saprospiraceae bacterium]|nr:hypothetical protein [Saprospiraceae bacterium]